MRAMFLAVLTFASVQLATLDLHTYKYKCPECSRVEEFDNTGTHYCYGSEGHKHSKTVMNRYEAGEHKTYKFRCPECGRIEEFDNNDTHYCYGSEGHKHSKTVMQHLKQ